MRLIILSLISVLSISAQCQKNKKEVESFYVFDKDWKGTTIEKAVYMIYVLQKNDTTWQWNYYNYLGPLLYIETYRSDKSEIPHGYHAYFAKNGKIDSSGYYWNGKRNGEWSYYGDSLSAQRTVTFSAGSIIKEWERTKDTSRNGPSDPNEKEAEFKNGSVGWKKYLTSHLNLPARAESNNVHGKVLVRFIVNKEGKVELPQIIKSVEFSVDKEAIRVLDESPLWKPGFQFGKNVNSYHIQPINF